MLSTGSSPTAEAVSNYGETNNMMEDGRGAAVTEFCANNKLKRDGDCGL